jgi:ApbE superfamily uncharacterized protein (UPF0280 family)
MYEARTYRERVKSDDLVSFEVVVKETDLLIRAESDLQPEAREAVHRCRHQIESYIAMNPGFERSLVPVEEDAFAPKIIREMICSSRLASVGPMASVAGAVAESVGRELLARSGQVIVENGGDLFLASSRLRTVAIYAGASPLSMKLGLVIEPGETPLGVCTSSGTVGPSLSFGKADAVCIVAPSAALADAAATAVGNRVRRETDIEEALDRGMEIEGVLGVLVIMGERLGAWGRVRLARLE